LQVAPSGYRRRAAQQRNPALGCAREQRDAELVPQIQRVWHANLEVYGADKVWRQMNREDFAVARCTVERLMKRLQLQGVRRGKVVRTTRHDPAIVRPFVRIIWCKKKPLSEPDRGFLSWIGIGFRALSP
jgi:putative transposase